MRTTSETKATDLLVQLIAQLDGAGRALALLEDDPVTALDEASAALDRSRAVLRLFAPDSLLKAEKPILDRAATQLRPLRDRYVATIGIRFPPPLAPSTRVSISAVAVLVLGARIRLADAPSPSTDTATSAAELDRSYRRARRRWRRLLDDPSPRAAGRAGRAIRRLHHQLEAIGAGNDRARRLAELADQLDWIGVHEWVRLDPPAGQELDGATRALGRGLFSWPPRKQAAWVESELRLPLIDAADEPIDLRGP